ncbi:MAG: hypothetical protein ABJL18_05740 [Hyphomicrobiales bacterium]
MYDLAAMARSIISYIENPEIRKAQSLRAIAKIKKDWDYLSYQNDLYELVQETVPAAITGWPVIETPFSPEHLVIMNASSDDLDVFECDGHLSQKKSLDVALIGGRFDEEAETVAARLRHLGHRVRHHQPNKNDKVSRASLVAKLLDKPRPKAATFFNTLSFVMPSQLKPLTYRLHAVETRAKANALYQALPYLASLTLTDDQTAEYLIQMNPDSEKQISFLNVNSKSRLLNSKKKQTR